MWCSALLHAVTEPSPLSHLLGRSLYRGYGSDLTFEGTVELVTSGASVQPQARPSSSCTVIFWSDLGSIPSPTTCVPYIFRRALPLRRIRPLYVLDAALRDQRGARLIDPSVRPRTLVSSGAHAFARGQSTWRALSSRAPYTRLPAIDEAVRDVGRRQLETRSGRCGSSADAMQDTVGAVLGLGWNLG